MSTEENKPQASPSSPQATAQETQDERPSRFPPDDEGSRPGWFGVGLASLAAAAFGGLLGQGFSDQNGSGDGASTELVGDVDAIAASQRAMEQRLIALQARTEALAEIEPPTVETGPGEKRLETLGETVDELLARIDILEAEAAMSATDVDPITDPARAVALPDALVDEIESIRSRISAIETADAEAEGMASPRMRNRAITQLEERVTALETAQLELAELMETRSEAIESLIERMAAAEVALNSAPVDEEAAARLEGLRADLDQLRMQLAGLASGEEASVSEPELAERRGDAEPEATAPLPEETTDETEAGTGSDGAKGEADGGAEAADTALEAEPTDSEEEAEPEPISVRPENVVEPPVLREAGSMDLEAARSAFGEIRRAAARGSRFEAAHGRLAEALPGEPLVAELAAFAQTGAPTTVELAERFAALPAPENLGAPAPEDMEAAREGWDWLQRTTGVDVNLPAREASDGQAAGFAAAKNATRSGDLEGAIAHLEALDPDALPEAADGWLADARRRIQIESLLDRLEDRLTNSDN